LRPKEFVGGRTVEDSMQMGGKAIFLKGKRKGWFLHHKKREGKPLRLPEKRGGGKGGDRQRKWGKAFPRFLRGERGRFGDGAMKEGGRMRRSGRDQISKKTKKNEGGRNRERKKALRPHLQQKGQTRLHQQKRENHSKIEDYKKRAAKSFGKSFPSIEKKKTDSRQKGKTRDQRHQRRQKTTRKHRPGA